MPLRVVFMGTPEFALPTLAGLIGGGHDIVAVYCQPPRPAGRGMSPRQSPVAVFAEGAGLATLTPVALRGEAAAADFAAHGADVAVVVAYGLLLPPAILAAPRLGCLNLHPSMLPRWRGAAPIQRTLMAGDTHTAIAVMRMAPGLDSGPVCLSEPIAIPIDMTAGELHDMAARRGADLMARALGALERGSLACQPQSAEGATHAAKIGKGEARIDWRRPAAEVHNRIRGLSPYPGAWFEIDNAGARERVKVLRSMPAPGAGAPGERLADGLTIACATGAVRLLTLQRAGGKPMAAEEFLRGAAWPGGTVAG